MSNIFNCEDNDLRPGCLFTMESSTYRATNIKRNIWFVSLHLDQLELLVGEDLDWNPSSWLSLQVVFHLDSNVIYECISAPSKQPLHTMKEFAYGSTHNPLSSIGIWFLISRLRVITTSIESPTWPWFFTCGMVTKPRWCHVVAMVAWLINDVHETGQWGSMMMSHWRGAPPQRLVDTTSCSRKAMVWAARILALEGTRFRRWW